MHLQTEPSILYFGTPVVLISTKNENGTDNLAPMSSIFWLGWRCVIGLSAVSKTTQNLIRNREGVLNLPSVNEVSAVNRLAKTTGSNPVPAGKLPRGYHYVEDKFTLAGLGKLPSAIVAAPRAEQCPVHMEVVVEAIHGLADNDEAVRGKVISFELRVVKVHLDESILMAGSSNHVDPDKWRPLIMSFQQFYGLGEKAHYSTLGEISESLYNTPDREKVIESKGALVHSN